MDAFYASVEQYDQPELRGKPVCVGGGRYGVVAAASYEARKFGIRSAMPGRLALEKCPHLIVVKPRFQRYKEISSQIRQIFYEYTDLVEPLSLDEAYLDVTENKMGIQSANSIAREIRQKILERTGLTASAGISVNKFLAKVASDYNKPNGQKTIHPTQVLPFMEKLPIEKFYGIGKVTANRMHSLHIFTGADLKAKSLEQLTELFGKAGKYYYDVVRGIHDHPVRPERIAKSVGVEETFWENLVDEDAVFEQLKNLGKELETRLTKKNLKGKTLTLKIKYSDFSLFTRSRSGENFFCDYDHIYNMALQMWQLRPFDRPVRLLGLSISGLDNGNTKQVSVQLKIPFEDYLT